MLVTIHYEVIFLNPVHVIESLDSLSILVLKLPKLKVVARCYHLVLNFYQQISNVAYQYVRNRLSGCKHLWSFDGNEQICEFSCAVAFTPKQF
jgi:hypothetical protein